MLNWCFHPTNSPKPKEIQFTIIKQREAENSHIGEAARMFGVSAWLMDNQSSKLYMCVFSGVEGGAVRVTGAKGFAPSHDYKVNISMTGFRLRGLCSSLPTLTWLKHKSASAAAAGALTSCFLSSSACLYRCVPPTWMVSGRQRCVRSEGRELQKRPDEPQTASSNGVWEKRLPVCGCWR